MLIGWAVRIHAGLLPVGACTLEVLSFLGNARNKSMFHDLPQRPNIGQCLLPVLKSYGYGYFSRNSDLHKPLLLHCLHIIWGSSELLKILSSINTPNILKLIATLFGMNISVMSFLYHMSLQSFSLMISSPKDFLGLDISFLFPNCCCMAPQHQFEGVVNQAQSHRPS